MLVFEIGHFHHLTFVCVRLCLWTPKFRLNRTRWSQVISKKMIFNMASVRHLEFGNFWIFVMFPSPYLKFASAYQISSNSDDSLLRYGAITIFKWRPSAMLDFRNLTFSSFIRHVRAIMPPHSNFGLNRTIWSRVIAKKWFSIWRPSAILDLGISEFFSHFRREGQNLHPRTKFRHIWTIRGWDMDYASFENNFQNGGRPPCWIYCDVIILCTTTEFNALEILLNFDIHRFHTFWYTSTIMFHHFSLKLPKICPNFSRIFGKKIRENVKFKWCNLQKAHLCVRPRVLNSRCLAYFYICDLYTRRKKLIDWLIDWLIDCLSDCVLVRKTRSAADADNRLDAFSGQSRSTNMVPFHM